MREVVDGLDNGDRGSLVEAWYRARYAPGATKRKQYQVKRTSGPNAQKTETRVADLVVDGEIREVKDVAGPIDTEQFGAYIDALNDDTVRSMLGVKKLRYVFTKLEGARQNMKFFVEKFEDKRVREFFTVEYFDANGVRHTVTSHDAALRTAAQLSGGG